jgi:hypothetical protein
MIRAQGHDDDRRTRMSEESMERSVQDALAREGIAVEVLAAGQFSPRGRSGSLFLGGVAGDSLGGVAGAAGAAVGTVAGMAGATEATGALRGLPDHMVVGVTADAVYGFAGAMKAGPLAFQIPREHLKATVHQRVDVRVLELTDEESGSKIELEGNRLPMTHSKDVISELTG